MTDSHDEFTEAFSRFVRDGGCWRDCEPEALFTVWRTFVESCRSGYRGEAEDYFDDLTARGSLDEALRNPDLARFPELEDLKQRVLLVDEEFRKILRPDAFPRMPEHKWWSRGIVRFAGDRLVRELKETYGVTIDRKPGSDSSG